MVSVGGNGIASGCGDAYAVEGVTFRLVEIPSAAFAELSTGTRDEIEKLATESELGSLPIPVRRARLSRLRNVLASACFGDDEDEQFAIDPWTGLTSATPAPLGLLDGLRASCLIDGWDVPLALVHWTDRGVRFIDMWSVRRRPTRASGHALLLADRWSAEAEARLFQFEDQVAGIVGLPVSQATLNLVEARVYFRYLPPISIVPLSSIPSERGFAYDAFLTGVVHRDREFIEGAGLRSLVNDSLRFRRFDLDGSEGLFTYELRENVQAAIEATGDRPHRVVVLSSAQMEHAPWARFDVARWDYANYAD
jgi:hypothetical protein